MSIGTLRGEPGEAHRVHVARINALAAALKSERTQVADLKARLRAVRQLCHENPSHEVDAALERATDLRVKNWRQP